MLQILLYYGSAMWLHAIVAPLQFTDVFQALIVVNSSMAVSDILAFQVMLLLSIMGTNWCMCLGEFVVFYFSSNLCYTIGCTLLMSKMFVRLFLQGSKISC